MAAALLALIAMRERFALLQTSERASASAEPSATTEAGAALARARMTANVYAGPGRDAEVLAVLPAGQRAGVEGRATDGEWVQVVFPPGTGVRGWVRAASLELEPASLQTLPVVASAAVVALASGTPAPASPPDPALSDVFLIHGKQLAVAIRNLGNTAITEATLGLAVTKAEGDIVGVLTIGPATLAGGASATVVTPLVIEQPGSYRVTLTPEDGAPDAQSSNNSRQVLLVPGAD